MPYYSSGKSYHFVVSLSVLWSHCDLSWLIILSLLQEYKEHINGAANQKWSYDDNRKVLMAFYSDQLDKDITAAIHTSVCTYTITGTEEISQPVSDHSAKCI